MKNEEITFTKIIGLKVMSRESLELGWVEQA